MTHEIKKKAHLLTARLEHIEAAFTSKIEERKAARRANNEIYDLTTNKTFKQIPIGELQAILEKYGFDDPGMSHAYYPHDYEKEITKTFHISEERMLRLSYYRYKETMNYDVTAYIT